ncbi:MAG: DUF560 domain-containing protein [Gammaproteobacteria bacterium]|nr:DUF560 domain-containing protein [Gammaproteobacteria bacterium]
MLYLKYAKHIALIPVVFYILMYSPFSISASEHQANDDFYQMLFKAYQTKQIDEFFLITLKYRNEWEGDAVFDYFSGISAIDQGDVSEGIFSLERVLNSEEKSHYFNEHLVRIELARGYFLLGDNEKSRLLFNETLALNPPQSVKDRVQSYLNAIDDREEQYKPKFSAFIQQSIGHDNNVTSLPNEIVRFFGVFASNLKGESDIFSETKIGVSYHHPLSRKSALFFNTDYFNHNNSTVDEMDNDGINFNAGGSYQYEKSYFNASYYHQHYNLNGDSYRKMDGLLSSYKYILSDKTLLTANLNLVQFDYDDNLSLDALESVYRVGAMHQLQGNYQPLVYFQVYYGETDADENDALANAITERTFNGVELGLQIKPLSEVTLAANYSYQDSHYQDQHPLFSSKRRDYLNFFSLSANWKIKKNWNLLANINTIDNASSLTLYKYRKTYGQVGVRYDF